MAIIDIHLNTPLMKQIIKYMVLWIQLSRSKYFFKVPFLAFLVLHSKEEEVRSGGIAPCYSQSLVVYVYQVLGL